PYLLMPGYCRRRNYFFFVLRSYKNLIDISCFFNENKYNKTPCGI
ncbi:MAG: hypothetical protein ACI86C_000523, partial [Candidatus Latescibacterota bacterium]